MTMAVEQMPQQQAPPTLTEIGVLPGYGQQHPLQHQQQHGNRAQPASLMIPSSNSGSAAGFYDPYNERRSLSMSK